MSDIHNDTFKQFREQQQKYAYYIIALCVAGIGFAVQKTIGLPLTKSQIPLAGSVLCWGLSIFTGLKFVSFQILGLWQNTELIRVGEGNHELTGRNVEKVKIGVDVITKAIENTSKNTMRFAKWQDRLFYLGIICFVGWRIWEMYLITPNISN